MKKIAFFTTPVLHQRLQSIYDFGSLAEIPLNYRQVLP